jgi:membrane associated rhomboid family serine protease
MTPTPVGMRCPECANQRTRVTRGVSSPGTDILGRFPATVALIAINVIVYLVEIGKGHGGLEATNNPLLFEFGLFGPSVAEGEWYRLLTSGFIHGGLWHIGGNMLLLYFIGRVLEPAIGTPRFLAVYFVSLFAGSLGALATSPGDLSYGASGAVFGVLGATLVIARHHRIDGLVTWAAFLIVLNLAYSFGAAGISVGAHIGGLIAGIVCALVIAAGERGMLGPRRYPVEMAVMVALGAISIVVAIAIA